MSLITLGSPPDGVSPNIILAAGPLTVPSDSINNLSPALLIISFTIKLEPDCNVWSAVNVFVVFLLG